MSDPSSVFPPPRTSSLAIASLVFGILSWILLPFVGAIVAIICGHLARSEIRRGSPDNPVEGDGLAVAGLMLGYVQLALGVVAAIVVILFIGMAFGNWFQ